MFTERRENVRLLVFLRADAPDGRGPGGARPANLALAERREEHEKQRAVDVREQEETIREVDTRR